MYGERSEGQLIKSPNIDTSCLRGEVLTAKCHSPLILQGIEFDTEGKGNI